MKVRNKSIALSLLISGLTAQTTFGLISPSTVYVGDIGNAADWTGRGSVDYGYWIGKYEVTATEYTAFLNAVAKTDSYSLYHPNMGFTSTISRSGASGSYTYTVVGNGNRPVEYVNWFDAARFVNWLHNGQPTGPQGAGTTETGAYTLNGALTGTTFTRNPGALYWIPSDNEWYKAAYYQPASQGGDADSYWLYPTRSNTQPNSRNGSASDPNSANYYYDDGIANGYNGGYAINNSTTTPFDGRMPVGAFTQAYSYYGTFDQGGNVFEWNEFASGSGRELVGGSWMSTAVVLQAVNYFNVSDPSIDFGSVGFRIAAIPEPGSVTLLSGFALVLTGRLVRRSR